LKILRGFLHDDTESNWMVKGENVTKPDDNRHHSFFIGFSPKTDKYCGQTKTGFRQHTFIPPDCVESMDVTY
jgi:hypothetical protein